jgi:hypothetical protein
MESGQTRARRVRRDYATTISAEATMTRSQAALFWGFWDYEANLGETAVYMPLLAEDGVIDQRLVRIVPDPKEEVIGGALVKITLSLLLIQPGRLTEDTYEYYLDGGSVDIIESQAALFYDPLATVANTTIPGEIN